MGPGWLNCPVAKRISDSVIRTITVRMRVARSELMPSTPTLAKIAVSAANTADRTAQNCQELRESEGHSLSARHCERSEAIHRAASGKVDCLVASLLAMTRRRINCGRRAAPAAARPRRL